MLLAAAGCSVPALDGPTVLVVDVSRYGAAFDAALDASRAAGLVPALRDRRRGVIETEPAPAATLLEPWASDYTMSRQSLENTLAHRRRRARFEFVPFGYRPPPSTGEALPGPDLLALDEPRLDLTAAEGALELRVWVYLERAQVRGTRRSTWAVHVTRRADTPSIDEERVNAPAVFWRPVARDHAFERRLLGAVDRAMRGS